MKTRPKLLRVVFQEVGGEGCGSINTWEMGLVQDGNCEVHCKLGGRLEAILTGRWDAGPKQVGVGN